MRDDKQYYPQPGSFLSKIFLSKGHKCRFSYIKFKKYCLNGTQFKYNGKQEIFFICKNNHPYKAKSDRKTQKFYCFLMQSNLVQ